MKNIKIDYLKYYWLEKDFFPEIYKFFKEKHYLTPEQFFSIIIWKRNPSKTVIKRKLLATNDSLETAVKKLTGEIYKSKDNNDRLLLLLEPRGNGIGLAIASAILTVLFPNIYTIYDFRVWGQVGHHITDRYGKSIRDITYRKDRVALYWKYVALVKKTYPELSLRNCDRLFWAKSWYEDLHKFLKD